MEKLENTQQNKMTDEDLDQVSGGVNDIIQNELYVDANKIDLHNPDFLYEEN